MSNYKNFIQDFPERCGEILADYRSQARNNGREVTHLFAIAAAALLIPFERLRKSATGNKHPSRDKEIYESAAGKFAKLCDKSFLNSELWNVGARSWKVYKIMGYEVERGPEGWLPLDGETLPDQFKVVGVLEHIRNALAHGSIFTLPDVDDQIENIIFLSEERDKGKFTGNYISLTVSPEDFTEFLMYWIRFLSQLKLPLV